MIAFCCILKKPAIEFLGCCTRMLQLSTSLGDNIACCPAKVEKGQTVFFFFRLFFLKMAGHILCQTVQACGQQEGRKAHKDFQRIYQEF